jgi:hypothetical protein
MRILAALLPAALLTGCLVNTELYDELSDQFVDSDSDSEVDADGDGFSELVDCDDADPAVHPEAEEVCNGVDDDCDEVVDEDATDASAWYGDGDGDGYGTGEAISACEAPSGTVSNDQDCDDGDAGVYPGSSLPELPDDDVDQDCDGNPGCSDLDCDGLPDVVIPSQRDDVDYQPATPIWFGTGASLGESPHQTLECPGAVQAVAQDFDRDGWVDLALVPYYDGEGSELEAVVYMGAEGGLSDDRYGTVPTVSALDATAADLDQDGWPDLVITSGTVDSGDASIYWGSPDGLDQSVVTTLPTSGTYRVIVSDLDSDGWEDLLFVSYTSSRGFETISHVYWNTEGSFDAEDFGALPSHGAVDGLAVDLDLDGYQEVVLANYESDTTLELVVAVYQGGPYGYDDGDVTELKAYGARDVEAADLDQDGWPDLVVAHYASDSSTQIDSLVYWGSENGLSADNATALPTSAAKAVAIADLDGDGWLDLVFANYYGLAGTSTDSTIYYGSSSGFSTDDSTGLPTVGATRVTVGDVDLDGWPDLLFTQYTTGVSFQHSSYLYYGSEGGFADTHRDELDVAGPWGPAVMVGLDAGGAR